MRIYTYAPPLTRSQVIIVNMCIPQRTCMYDRVYAYILVYIHTPLPLFPILLSITPNTSQHTLYIPYLHLIHLHHTFTPYTIYSNLLDQLLRPNGQSNG